MPPVPPVTFQETHGQIGGTSDFSGISLARALFDHTAFDAFFVADLLEAFFTSFELAASGQSQVRT